MSETVIAGTPTITADCRTESPSVFISAGVSAQLRPYSIIRRNRPFGPPCRDNAGVFAGLQQVKGEILAGTPDTSSESWEAYGSALLMGEDNPNWGDDPGYWTCHDVDCSPGGFGHAHKIRLNNQNSDGIGGSPGEWTHNEESRVCMVLGVAASASSPLVLYSAMTVVASVEYTWSSQENADPGVVYATTTEEFSISVDAGTYPPGSTLGYSDVLLLSAASETAGDPPLGGIAGVAAVATSITMTYSLA